MSLSQAKANVAQAPVSPVAKTSCRRLLQKPKRGMAKAAIMRLPYTELSSVSVNSGKIATYAFERTRDIGATIDGK
jgi:hypothetical protein